MSVLQMYGPGRRRILTPYVLIWVAVAVFAMGYLALLGVRPELFARSGASDIAQQLAQTKRDMTRAVADLDPLRRTVGEIKLDVANLKYGTNELAQHQNELGERVTALEASVPKVARVGEATTDSAPAQVAPPAPTRDPRKAAARPAKPGAAVVPPLPGHPAPGQPKNAKVLNGATKQQAAPSETGSIAGKTAPSTAPPKTQVAAHTTKPAAAAKTAPVGVLLATGPSVDALRLNWTILNDRHGEAVKNLAPRYVVSGPANKRVYSLVAGPVASAEQAKTLCHSMAEKGLACEVSAYRGSSL